MFWSRVLAFSILFFSVYAGAAGPLSAPADGACGIIQVGRTVIYTSTTPREILDSVVKRVIAFQKQFIVKRDVHLDDIQRGFLISEFTIQELTRLVRKGGKLLIIEEDGEIQAYALITPIYEFTDLYKDPEHGIFYSKSGFSDFSEYEYLYQIAVAKDQGGTGLGTAMIRAAAEKSEKRGLLTDVLIEPLHNSSSSSFFRKNGYKDIGVLTLSEYRDFGKLKSEVLLWTR